MLTYFGILYPALLISPLYCCAILNIIFEHFDYPGAVRLYKFVKVFIKSLFRSTKVLIDKLKISLGLKSTGVLFNFLPSY